jgi:hypothetical protein
VDILVHSSIKHFTVSHRIVIGETCGAENWNSFVCNKFSTFLPEVLKTMLFQNG